MSNTLNLFSFNARSLGDRKKRMAVFLWLKSKGSGVYLLQECHSTANSEQIWQQDWDGRIEFSHGILTGRIEFSHGILTVEVWQSL